MGEDTKLPIVLLNGTVATTNGIYSIKDVEITYAKALIDEYGFISAIGHEATVAIVSEVLGVPVSFNRIRFEQQVGQIAIVFRLNERAPEGSVLSRQELESIGYSFKLMERLS